MVDMRRNYSLSSALVMGLGSDADWAAPRWLCASVAMAAHVSRTGTEYQAAY